MGLLELLTLIGQGHVPAPAVGAHNVDALLGQPQGGLGAHAGAGNQVLLGAPALVRAGVEQHDVAGLDGVVDLGQVVLDVLLGDLVAVGLVTEVQLHARADAPLQGNLVDGPGLLAAGNQILVLTGEVMPGSIQMGAGVGAHLNEVDGPALTLGEVGNGGAGEESGHLLGGIFMVTALDLGDLNRGIAGQIFFQQHGQVYDFHKRSLLLFYRIIKDYELDLRSRLYLLHFPCQLCFLAKIEYFQGPLKDLQKVQNLDVYSFVYADLFGASKILQISTAWQVCNLFSPCLKKIAHLRRRKQRFSVILHEFSIIFSKICAFCVNCPKNSQKTFLVTPTNLV